MTSSVDEAGNLRYNLVGKSFTADVANILKSPAGYANIGEFLGAQGADAERITSELVSRSSFVREGAFETLKALGVAATAYDILYSVDKATAQYNSGDVDGADGAGVCPFRPERSAAQCL